MRQNQQTIPYEVRRSRIPSTNASVVDCGNLLQESILIHSRDPLLLYITQVTLFQVHVVSCDGL